MYQEVVSQPFALLELCACTPLAYALPSCHAAALQYGTSCRSSNNACAGSIVIVRECEDQPGT